MPFLKGKMAKLLSIIFCIFLVQTNHVQAQILDLSGNWKGIMEFNGNKMDIIVRFIKRDNEWKGALSSESLKLTDLLITNVRTNADTLTFKVPLAGGDWKGIMQTSDQLLKGEWIQGPLKAKLNFSRLEQDHLPEIKVEHRKQTPLPPFPYMIEEVEYTNENDGTRLAGTLTIPNGEGPFAAAILLSVAGPNNRDQSHGSPVHKPYHVLADHLTRAGIAVLRSDDRGVGGSTGNIFNSTYQDLAQDAIAAFNMLKQHPKINANAIGFIGNSEGSLIGPLAASINKETAFIITLGGIGVPGRQIILEQADQLGALNGYSKEALEEVKKMTNVVFDILLSDYELSEKVEQVRNLITKAEENADRPQFFLIPQSVDEQVKLFTSPWYISQIAHKPASILEKLQIPFLALHGDKDPFVNPVVNLEAIEKHLQKAGNNDVTVLTIKNVNHIFQDADNGSPAAYNSNEISFSPRALKIILEWLNNRF